MAMAIPGVEKKNVSKAKSATKPTAIIKINNNMFFE